MLCTTLEHVLIAGVEPSLASTKDFQEGMMGLRRGIVAADVSTEPVYSALISHSTHKYAISTLHDYTIHTLNRAYIARMQGAVHTLYALMVYLPPPILPPS